MSVPLVTLSAFSHLAGSALAGDVRRLAVSPGLVGLVLFSDPQGEQLALLPLGPGENYTRLEELHGLEIEGLRPLCAVQLHEASPAAAKLEEKARELARLEESLKARERFVADCEHKMAELGQTLTEREALLEQREQQLLAKEREFFRRGGELATRLAQ